MGGIPRQPTGVVACVLNDDGALPPDDETGQPFFENVFEEEIAAVIWRIIPYGPDKFHLVMVVDQDDAAVNCIQLFDNNEKDPGQQGAQITAVCLYFGEDAADVIEGL